MLKYLSMTSSTLSLHTFFLFFSGRPDSLENCSVVNQTSASLMVRCQPGFDGGLSQRYVMEVYVQHGQSLAGNVTADQPSFTVGDLRSGLGFDISIYAYNSRGTSDPIQLQAYTLKSAEKRTGMYCVYYYYVYYNIVVYGIPDLWLHSHVISPKNELT